MEMAISIVQLVMGLVEMLIVILVQIVMVKAHKLVQIVKEMVTENVLIVMVMVV
jgi:hypothetical protein